MGLLDDAIRDHLDLKRRHGADPAEVEQKEREALGPVRRDPFEQSGDEFEPSAEAAPVYDDEEGAYEDEGYEPADQPEAGEGDWGDAFDEEHAREAPAVERPASAVPHDEPAAADSTRVLEPEELDEGEPALYEDPAVPPPHPAGAGAETVEYDVEEAFEAEPRHRQAEEHAHPQAEEPREGTRQDEDVLEETPEFLQDTPDHDRLWFEQRPPKDFDFDG